VAWLVLILYIAAVYSLLGGLRLRPDAASTYRAGIALGFGALMPGAVAFASSITGRFQPPPAILMAAVLAALILAGWWLHRTPQEPNPNPTPWNWLQSCALATLALALLGWWLLTAVNPHGDWDAWSIHNLKARIFHTAADWTLAFRTDLAYAHPEYPPLVSLATAAFWHWHGDQATAFPAAINLLCALGLLLVVSAFVAQHKGPKLGWIAAGLMAGTVDLWRLAASQYADTPLAFLFAVTLAATLQGAPITAGLAAALAAFTKQEGLAFLAAFVVIVLWRSRHQPQQLLRYLAGLIPPLILVAIFKTQWSPESKVLSELLTGLSRISFERLFRILISFGYEFLSFSAGILVALLIALFFAKPNFKSESVRVGSLLIGIQFLAYCAVYLTTKDDLNWLLSTSASRLVLQLWPLIALTLVLAIDPSVFQPAPAAAAAARKPSRKKKAA
jgi:hypothetical protein